MSEKEYARIIGANLKRIAYEHGKSQVQMSHEKSESPIDKALQGFYRRVRFPLSA